MAGNLLKIAENGSREWQSKSLDRTGLKKVDGNWRKGHETGTQIDPCQLNERYFQITCAKNSLLFRDEMVIRGAACESVRLLLSWRTRVLKRIYSISAAWLVTQACWFGGVRTRREELQDHRSQLELMISSKACVVDEFLPNSNESRWRSKQKARVLVVSFLNLRAVIAHDTRNKRQGCW